MAFWSRAETPVVEIGNDLIKVAAVGASGPPRARVVLLKLARIRGELHEGVAQAFRRLRLRRDGAVLSLPRQLATVRQIELPSQQPDEIRDMVALQIDKQTPYARDEILAGYRVAAPAGNGYSRVLLAVARRNVVRERIEVLQRAGVSVERVALGAEGVFLHLADHPDLAAADLGAGAALLLDIDTNHTEAMVLREGCLVFTRTVPVGAEHFADAPSAAWDRIVREVRHALKLYATEERGVVLERVFLAGLTGACAEMDEILSARLGMPVAILPPRGRVEVSRLEESEACAEEASSASVLGIGAHADALAWDLTPPDLWMRQRLAARRTALSSFGALVLCVAGLLGLCLATHYYARLTYLNALRNELRAIEGTATAVEKMRRSIHGIEERLDARGTTLDMLHEVQALAPETIRLTSVRLDARQRASIQGRAEAMSDIFKFVTVLEASPLFENVKTTHAAKREEGGQVSATFEILCAYERQPAPGRADGIAEEVRDGTAPAATLTSARPGAKGGRP